MLYRVLADVTVVLHLLFIVFVVAGGLLALRWRWATWVHLPAALWGTLIEAFGWVCPLTPLENTLRRAAGEAGYSGGFIQHYIMSLVYPGVLSYEVQLLLAGGVLAANVVVYGIVWRRRRRRAAPDSTW